jgi:NSS family neurotransmitter:Na+ symporter
VACFTAFWTIVYYNVVMAWTWLYLYHSFTSPLPWGSTIAESREFQNKVILGKSSDPGCEIPLSCGMGSIHWPIVLALFVQWTVVFLCCYKGVKGVGKVVMVTMPLPGIMMLVLVGYGSSLSGASNGIRAYIGSVDTEQLGQVSTWVDAVSQIFFGLSICSGGMITYGAAQPKTAKSVNNAWVIGLADTFFSLISGFAIYTIIAHLAFEEGRGIQDYDDALAGYTLSFVTFPVAISKMATSAGGAVANFFAVLFFCMMLSLGSARFACPVEFNVVVPRGCVHELQFACV